MTLGPIHYSLAASNISFSDDFCWQYAVYACCYKSVLLCEAYLEKSAGCVGILYEFCFSAAS